MILTRELFEMLEDANHHAQHLSALIDDFRAMVLVLSGEPAANPSKTLTNLSTSAKVNFVGTQILAEGERDADNRLIEPVVWVEPDGF